MTDCDLNEGLAADLDRTFEPLVVAYQERIYRFALRYSGTREDAEETAQDAFVRAYHALQNLFTRATPGAELAAVAVHDCPERGPQQGPAQAASFGFDRCPFPGAEGPLEIEEPSLCRRRAT